MIPRADITEWRNAGYSWKTDTMVEQDLIISRILVELFGNKRIAEELVFRGGTALHKLLLDPPLRYSEDIDLVQSRPGPIGPVFDTVRATFRGWLGEPKRKIGHGLATLTYRLESEDTPPLPIRIKIEINTREHFQIRPREHRPFTAQCRWFEGSTTIPVFQTDELLATKMRALYQRRKGRDLFDLAVALRTLDVEPARIVEVFRGYLDAEGHRIAAAEYRANLLEKLGHPGFEADCPPLLRPGTTCDLKADFDLIDQTLISLLP